MIREFFLDEVVSIPFHLFGIIHFGCLAILIFLLIAIYRNRNKIKQIKNKKKIKIAMFILLMINMLIWYGSYIYYGIYDIRIHLPLHFCFIAGNLFMLYLITGWKSLYKVTFFFTFIGPLPAVLFPDLVSSFDAYIFYQYFISHHLLMVFSYFTFYMDDITITYKDAVKTFIWGNILFITMMNVNEIFGTNYIMSKKLPDHIYELFPIFQTIHPFIILEITGIIVVLMLMIPVNIKNKEDRYGSK